MNLFYKLGVLVAIIITTLTGSAQSKSYRIFDEFANHDGFTYLAFSKSMIDAVNLNLDDENKKITGDLNEIRILILNREKSNLGVHYPRFFQKNSVIQITGKRSPKTEIKMMMLNSGLMVIQKK